MGLSAENGLEGNSSVRRQRYLFMVFQSQVQLMRGAEDFLFCAD